MAKEEKFEPTPEVKEEKPELTAEANAQVPPLPEGGHCKDPPTPSESNRRILGRTLSLSAEQEPVGQDPIAPSLRKWVENAPALQPENFREQVLHITDHILDTVGGPVQYLEKVLGSSPGPGWTEFTTALRDTFPQRPDLTYWQQPALPSTGETFNMSLWHLGWTKDCSSKPATFKVTARRLIDEFLTHSFVSDGDPILLCQGPTDGVFEDHASPLFFTHYVKGAARATSVLFLAHVLIFHLKADVASLNPALWASLQRLACRMSLVATDASISLLLAHASHFGEATAFTGESFANKKKLEKETLEEALNMAQTLSSCIDELVAQHPIPMQMVEERVLAPFLEGNGSMELELQAAFAEGKASFQPAELTWFQELIATCLSKRDDKLTAIGQGPKISAGELEAQAFQLALASADHDFTTYESWRIKCNDRDAALYFQQLQHTAKRQAQAKDVASSLLKTGAAWQMHFEVMGPRDAVNMKAAIDMADQVMRMNQLQDRESVHCVSIINWSSPSTYSAQLQKGQAHLTGALVNGDGNMFCVAYSGKTDDRERRALMQPGVILFPGGTDENKSKVVWQVFRSAKVFQQAVLTEVPMLPSNQMLVIEDMNEDALPASSDTTTHVSQAEKHQQIGQDAARKVLQSIVPSDLQSRAAILVVDTTAHTLEFAKAAYLERASKSITIPLYYLGFSASAGEKEWQVDHLCTWLTEGFLSGELPYPSGAPPLMAKELPPEVTTALPPKPELTTLTWSTKKVEGLQTIRTPDKLPQTWHDHPRHGQEFQEWLARVQKTEPATLEPLDLPDLPKPLRWQAALPSPHQRGKGNVLKLVITIGNRKFIANEGTSGDVTLPAGTTLAGYYKGQFLMQGQKGKTQEDFQARPADCLYEIENSNSEVFFEGKLSKLGRVVAQKRAVTPLSVNICYYELAEQPRSDDTTFFALRPKNQALFRPENAPTSDDKKGADGSFTLPLTSMAGCLETTRWATPYTKVVWSVKWSARGLQPIRPVIALTTPLVVPQSKAVELKHQ
ncbi:unnamed protein product [Durusdinium trenchii]|uniref:Uncharacterized protein n=1 Tax=Durusdinium trenchii TaxID=1381693 RepID=A0ABP0SZZ8_9DINO